MTSTPSRRGFLGALAVAGAGAAVAAAEIVGSARSAGAADASAPGPSDSYAFHGSHQQGILTAQQAAGAFLAFDVTATGRAELQALLRTLTDRARFLTAGGIPQTVGISAPESDSGVLGPDVVPDGLTVTVGVGASLFDERFGLASARPAKLKPMTAFAADDLDPAICGGDLLVQLCANSSDTVVHAIRDITRATAGSMQLRWRQDGFVSPPRPSGTPRNLMGFKDGTANPDRTDAALMDQLVWTHSGGEEPAWVEGGSYHAVRIIRMFVEFWDRVNLLEQEDMIGRRRASGAPQTGTNEFDTPNFVADPTGDVIQFNAHIRLANPRTTATDSQRMLRRPYNYDNGIDSNGTLAQGLVFVAFNQDLDRQFIAVQNRLENEPLIDYISPIGGGYFFALPGVRDGSDWYGKGMFA